MRKNKHVKDEKNEPKDGKQMSYLEESYGKIRTTEVVNKFKTSRVTDGILPIYLIIRNTLKMKQKLPYTHTQKSLPLKMWPS